MLAELRDARALAEQAAKTLRREELEIEELRSSSLAAIQEVKRRSPSSLQNAQALEDAVNRLVSPKYLSLAASLRECAQLAENLEPIIEQADSDHSESGVVEAARHLREFARNFASLRQLAQAAAKNNEEALDCLRQIRAVVALM